MNNNTNWRCVSKVRDKAGVITDYVLELIDMATNQSLGRQIINAQTLKEMLNNKRIDVINLKLTSDNRIISVNPEEQAQAVNRHSLLRSLSFNKRENNKNVDKEQVEKAIGAYKRNATNEEKSKLSYLTKKMASKPYTVSAIVLALTLGIGAATGVQIEKNKQAENEAKVMALMNQGYADEMGNLDTQKVINESDSIVIDGGIGFWNIDIKSDGVTIGSVDRDIVGYSVSHGMSVKDNDGNTLISYSRDGLTNGKFTDGAGNVKYTMIRTDFIGKPGYDIKDSNGNVVAKLKENWTLKGKFREVELTDASGSLIANGGRHSKNDFKIEFGDSEQMENIDAMSIITQFLMKKAVSDDSAKSKINSNSSKSGVDYRLTYDNRA